MMTLQTQFTTQQVFVLGGGHKMYTSNVCAHCQEDVKCRRRDFSEQAWAVLVIWGEIEKDTIHQPICEHCYNELRDILIERASDIEAALSQPAAARPAKKEKKISKIAS